MGAGLVALKTDIVCSGSCCGGGGLWGKHFDKLLHTLLTYSHPSLPLPPPKPLKNVFSYAGDPEKVVQTLQKSCSHLSYPSHRPNFQKTCSATPATVTSWCTSCRGACTPVLKRAPPPTPRASRSTAGRAQQQQGQQAQAQVQGRQQQGRQAQVQVQGEGPVGDLEGSLGLGRQLPVWGEVWEVWKV